MAQRCDHCGKTQKQHNGPCIVINRPRIYGQGVCRQCNINYAPLHTSGLCGECRGAMSLGELVQQVERVRNGERENKKQE